MALAPFAAQQSYTVSNCYIGQHYGAFHHAKSSARSHWCRQIRPDGQLTMKWWPFEMGLYIFTRGEEKDGLNCSRWSLLVKITPCVFPDVRWLALSWLDTVRGIAEKSQLLIDENAFLWLVCHKSAVYFLDWWLMWVGSEHYGWSRPQVLGAMRKETAQATGSKPVSTASPWSLLQFLLPGSCLDFLPWLPFTMNTNWDM